MPTQESLARESFLWSVVYPAGERLNEWDPCDHDLEGKPENSGHVFACIDKQRAVSMGLYADRTASRPDYFVRCEGPTQEPIFFRRRPVDAPWNSYIRSEQETQADSETWIGVRDMVDGKTVNQVFLRVVREGAVEVRYDSERN